MKVQAIITRVRNISGDNDAIQYSDSSIRTWINDATRECAASNLLLQKKGTLAVVSGTKEYALPDDILKLHSIKYNGERLSVYTLEEAEHRGDNPSDSGTPSYCYIFAGNIELYPTPASDTDTLEIYYSRQPVDVQGSEDEPDLPQSYHARLVDYCLAQIAQQDDDLNRYQLKMQEFRTGVQTLKDMPEWNNDLYPYITVGGHDYGNGYLSDGEY